MIMHHNTYAHAPRMHRCRTVPAAFAQQYPQQHLLQACACTATSSCLRWDAACLTLHACAQVDPKRQKLLGLKTKDGKMATDEAAIADLAIKPNTKVHHLQPAQRTGSVCECRSCQITTVPVIQHAVHQESSSASSNAAAQATGSPPTSFKPPHACLMWTTAAGDDDGSA